MAKPDIIIIGGRAYRGQEICQLRRQQLEPWNAAQPRQLALFDLKDDCRPAAERTAAGYAEPIAIADMITLRAKVGIVANSLPTRPYHALSSARVRNASRSPAVRCFDVGQSVGRSFPG
jgi:hypothetical protein